MLHLLEYYTFGLGGADFTSGLSDNQTVAWALRSGINGYNVSITELGDFYYPAGSSGPTLPGSGCFLAGTLITMADERQKPIEEIQIGDIVFAFNENTGQIELDTVTKVFSNLKEDAYFIINRTLKVTSEHPVLSKGRWVEIKDLKVGDTLTNTQVEDVTIFDIAKVEESVQTYNFQTNPLHTYIANGFIVHNIKKF